ncbi:hypothetical protein JB92DRAFT_3094972 [Gautieria morchelliformis]|nr:hypothetical protein JB92DRAFT_3094972 [Gautieria morchelliformis]
MIYISTFLTLFAFTVMPSVAAPIPAPDFKTSGSLSVRTNVDIGPLGPGSNSVASAEVAYGPDEEGFFKRRTAKRSDAEEMNYDSIPFKRGLADPDVATGSLEVNYAQDEEGLFKRRADDMEVNYAPDEEGYFKRRTAKRSDAEEMNYDSIPFKREFALEANYAKDEEGLFKRRTDDMEVNYAPDEEGYFKRRTAKRSDAEEMGYDPTPSSDGEFRRVSSQFKSSQISADGDAAL